MENLPVTKYDWLTSDDFDENNFLCTLKAKVNQVFRELITDLTRKNKSPVTKFDPERDERKLYALCHT